MVTLTLTPEEAWVLRQILDIEGLVDPPYDYRSIAEKLEHTIKTSSPS